MYLSIYFVSETKKTLPLTSRRKKERGREEKHKQTTIALLTLFLLGLKQALSVEITINNRSLLYHLITPSLYVLYNHF